MSRGAPNAPVPTYCSNRLPLVGHLADHLCGHTHTHTPPHLGHRAEGFSRPSLPATAPILHRSDMATPQDATASGHIIPDACLEFKGYRIPWPADTCIISLGERPSEKDFLCWCDNQESNAARLYEEGGDILADLGIPLDAHRLGMRMVLRAYNLWFHSEHGEFPTKPPSPMRNIAQRINLSAMAPMSFFIILEVHAQRYTGGFPSPTSMGGPRRCRRFGPRTSVPTHHSSLTTAPPSGAEGQGGTAPTTGSRAATRTPPRSST